MAASLKEGEIEELKSRADIQTIIAGYVNLKKAGKNFTGLCPFHKEKTPSFTVDARKQLYHCFGCSEGGDIISFIMKMENLQFLEAAEFLAKKINYSLKYNQEGAPRQTEKKSRLIEINELAARYYSYILFNSKVASGALDYLKKRGFNKDTIEKFEAGFSPSGWTNFCDFAIKKGFDKKDIIESGLALQSSRHQEQVYDRFRERIMFPIRDIVGRVVGFGARIFQENKNASSESSSYIKNAKYINTPETGIYSKSRNIYGLYISKKSIVENDSVLIVEGYTDVMALCQLGINNAVASLGTALTTEQVEILGRFTKNIILVFDSDAAGVSASLRGIERLREYNERLDLFHEGNIDMKVAVLEEGYDPADYIVKKGIEAFNSRIENSMGIIDFTINSILKKYNISDISSKLRAVSELAEFVSSLTSRIVQEDCVKKISLKLGLAESLIMEQLLKKMKIKSGSKYSEGTTENSSARDKSISPARNIEFEALKILINGAGKHFGDIVEIGEEYFRFDDTKEIYNIIKDIIKSSKDSNLTLNFPLEISSDKLKGESLKKLYNMIVFSPLNYSDYDFASGEVLKNLKKLYISDKIEQVKQLLKKYENFKKDLNKEAANKEQLLKLEKAQEKIRLLILKLNELEIQKRSFN
ncbi:MAG: DNA primase [Actinobacteria bacterium]|nr:DNA primase [Actinomycetota bacterium]